MSLTKSQRTPVALAAVVVFVIVLLFVLAAPQRPDASAATVRTGGLGVPGIAEVSDVVCVKQCVSLRKATPGATVRLTGRYLDTVRKVIFPGRTGVVRVSAVKPKFSSVRVTVPRSADDGRPTAVTAAGKRSRSPRALEILPVSRIPKEVFPVRGPHNYGSSGARFGAGRSGYSHQGQDVMAACGTRLVSIRRARVLFNQYHSAAGYYVVLKNLGTNSQFAYMHLIRRSSLRPGQVVGAGQTIGFVGQTGRAYGCHLHFEFWVGPWQRGGRPIDPLPYLRSL
jgi:murein DD-endopeptidase MepM/ murein hydrolase activator NlpD